MRWGWDKAGHALLVSALSSAGSLCEKRKLLPQARAGEGFHAAVLRGAEAQPSSGGARSCLFDHQGRLLLMHACRSSLSHVTSTFCAH